MKNNIILRRTLNQKNNFFFYNEDIIIINSIGTTKNKILNETIITLWNFIVV